MGTHDIAEMVRFHYERLDEADLEAVLSQMHEDVYFKHPPIWDFESDGVYEGIDGIQRYYDKRGRRENEHTVEKMLTDDDEVVAFVRSQNTENPDFEEHTALVYFRAVDGQFIRYEYGSCPGRFRY